jgi:ubiquinone/menaquinone biosynthesis C-methylase UbiE
MISIARKKVRHATFTQASLADSLPFPDKTFDVVTCVKVLFAVPNPEFTISELKRVLKDDGILIIDTPKAGWSMRPILKEHVKQAGWLKTLPIILRLFILASFNLFIFSKGNKKVYHFMDLSQIKKYFDSPIKSAYASQDWFTCAIKTNIQS